jgi:hypothetical protein
MSVLDSYKLRSAVVKLTLTTSKNPMEDQLLTSKSVPIELKDQNRADKSLTNQSMPQSATT